MCWVLKDPEKKNEQQRREKMAIVASFERMSIGDKVTRFAKISKFTRIAGRSESMF